MQKIQVDSRQSNCSIDAADERSVNEDLNFSTALLEELHLSPGNNEYSHTSSNSNQVTDKINISPEDLPAFIKNLLSAQTSKEEKRLLEYFAQAQAKLNDEDKIKSFSVTSIKQRLQDYGLSVDDDVFSNAVETANKRIALVDGLARKAVELGLPPDATTAEISLEYTTREMLKPVMERLPKLIYTAAHDDPRLILENGMLDLSLAGCGYYSPGKHYFVIPSGPSDKPEENYELIEPARTFIQKKPEPKSFIGRALQAIKGDTTTIREEPPVYGIPRSPAIKELIALIANEGAIPVFEERVVRPDFYFRLSVKIV